MLVRRGETYEVRPQERTRDLIIAGIAVIYTLFLVYAAGMQFLVLSAILYGPGTVLYFWTRREQNKTLFSPIEWGIFLVTAASVHRRDPLARDGLHHDLINGGQSWHPHSKRSKLRRPLGGWPAPQGDGLRAGPGPPAADAQQLRQAPVRRRPLGGQRQARPLRLRPEDARPRCRRGRDAQSPDRDGRDPRGEEVDPRQPGRAEPGGPRPGRRDQELPRRPLAA